MSANLLTDARKTAIADVAIASAELEAEVERCIVDLCKLWPGHGRVLLERASVDAKIGIFRQLLEAEFPDAPFLSEFVSVCETLKSLNSERNTVIHGQWVPKSWTNKKRKPGQIGKDIERKNIVAVRRNPGKATAVSAKKIKRVADLMILNQALLHELFWEHFRSRVSGLSGVRALPEIPAQQRREKIRKRGQSDQ